MLTRLFFSRTNLTSKARIGVREFCPVAVAVACGQGMMHDEELRGARQESKLSTTISLSIDHMILALGPQMANMNSSTGKYKHAIGARSKVK